MTSNSEIHNFWNTYKSFTSKSTNFSPDKDKSVTATDPTKPAVKQKTRQKRAISKERRKYESPAVENINESEQQIIRGVAVSNAITQAISQVQCDKLINASEVPFPEVIYKKKRRLDKPTIIGNNETITSKLAPTKAFLHVFKLHPELTNKELSKILVPVFPEVTWKSVCDSDHVHNVIDKLEGNVYKLRAFCFASFQKHQRYLVEIEINNMSGAVISGQCECEASTLGRCSHVNAILLFLEKYCRDTGHSSISSTSKLREWGLGTKDKDPDSGSEKWKIMRSNFFTSSLTKRMPSLVSDSAKTDFIRGSLWGLSKNFQSSAMKYGIEMESVARTSYNLRILDENEEMQQIGLVVNKNYPFLASSVDEIVLKNGEKSTGS
ncbi:hypothetical protein JTB14_022115 [Gonioctena quinquepunctata]|nr:hypothetical protein JTB14_022115 [Gonioctena quinquepunctata]